ncbi:MAG TPA: formate dehydrogenase accessory sulfurtransferase FdhD [Bryobacteraceae bacterium]|jgi:FdhD protein|nr:formate dehydrogenase accessory sulfurtransferase FdhD [Bryobacteraceae bacterium]
MKDEITSLVRRFDVKRISTSASERIIDTVAAEEPLSIRLSYWQKESHHTENLALTMRTPGRDRELAAGILVSEGIVHKREDIIEIRSLGTEPSNEVIVDLAPSVDVETWRLSRNSFVGASCGVCGKRSREALLTEVPETAADTLGFSMTAVLSIAENVKSEQAGFAQTGGLHAAALADLSGQIGQTFEDIGRHNALDKLVGWALLNNRLPLASSILFLSSRSSFELVQKAAMAGAPVLATVGGPSSLAIETARELGITLLGFVRTGRLNVYAGDWRLQSI